MNNEIKIPFIDISKFNMEFDTDIAKICSDVYSSGQLMDGEQTRNCEEKLSAIYSYPETVMTGSCTDALYFAMKALNIGVGDEVIVTVLSFIGTLSPILRAGAVPVFVDINPSDGLMEIDQIESKIGPRTKAIIAVHLYGKVLNMCKLNKLAEKHNLLVIEDAAQSIGIVAEYGNSIKSDAICLSFDPTKVIHAFGSAGAVICRDQLLAKKIRQIRYHGKLGNDFEILGYNSRINEVQAALVLFQLDKFEKIIQARKAIAEMYVAELSNFSEIVLPAINTPSNFHKFVIQHPNRNELKKFLELNGVKTMIHYEKCLNEYSLYKTDEVFTNAKRINNSCLSLPIYYGLNSNDLHIIINLLKSFNH